MNLSSLKKLTLLYVEDEKMIRQNAVEYLSRICDHVLEAQDGEEAFQIYKEEKPDIIITDIKMPKMNGLKLSKNIRKNDKETPIIITTAHTQTEYLLQAVELQLVKYLVKPITSVKLQEALSLSLDYLSMKSRNIVEIDSRRCYDLLNKTLIIDHKIVKLSKNEQELLHLLAQERQRAVSYEEIEAKVWQERSMSMDALRSLVRALRKKLEGDFVENISGIGYRLVIKKR